MSRKVRNDSAESSTSATDREIPLNLSNLSTTPTFSNVQKDVSREPISPLISGPPSDQNPFSGINTDNNNTGISSTQSTSKYNQPTFSFSRMVSSQIPMESVHLPPPVAESTTPSVSTTALQNYNSQQIQYSAIPSSVAAAAGGIVNYNMQTFGLQSSASTTTNVANSVGNRWNGMLRGSMNNSPGLMDKRRCVVVVVLFILRFALVWILFSSYKFSPFGTTLVNTNIRPRSLSPSQSERGGPRLLSQRPPISPNLTTSILVGQTQPNNPSLSTSSRIIRSRVVVPPQPPSSSPLKEEYDSILDANSVESPRETSSLHSSTIDNPLSTGLLTLSIHEALTFDGVELALHPDVFVKKDDGGENTASSASSSRPSNPQNTNNRGLKPGDLVEIRVWSVRPGVKMKNSNIASNTGSAMKSNTGGSNYHSRNPSLITLSSTSILSPGAVPVKNTNYHSRNPSLATLSSASILSPGNVQGGVNNRGGGVYNAISLVNTPQSSVAPDNTVNLVNAPPLPSIIGGASSPMARTPGSYPYDVKDRETPELHGEYLLENPQSDVKATPGTSNLSSTASTSLVGSTLPLDSLPTVPLISQRNKLSFSTIETDSVQGHSRDSSLVTSSSAMHSRENSLLSPNPSWLTAGGTGNTPSPKDEAALIQNLSTAALPSHPLAGLSAQQSPHLASSKKINLPILPSSSDKRPPLPPSNDVNVSLLSDPGTDDKKQLDLITEEMSPERMRASTTGSEEASHKRSNSILHSSGSNHALSSLLPKLIEDDGTAVDEEGDESNTMDEIQKTHFVRVSFVVPISERSLSCIKSGARTQVSLLRRG